jgi:16S rRNA (uracil1498-N3)-methyltransferase
MSRETHSLFFVSSVSANRAFFSPEEYRHAHAALRIDKEAILFATDGKGSIYTCKFTGQSRETGEVEIIDARRQEAAQGVVDLYIGLPDREAFEEALTCLSALGAARIVPVVCSYCQDAWWRPWEKRIERLQRKMIAGIKQARNPWMPDLCSPQPFIKALQAVCVADNAEKWHCVADAGGIGLQIALPETHRLSRVTCFIGPPGGFSPEEMNRFSIEGLPLIKIAHYRLRTELAAIVFCAEIMQRWL